MNVRETAKADLENFDGANTAFFSAFKPDLREDFNEKLFRLKQEKASLLVQFRK